MSPAPTRAEVLHAARLLLADLAADGVDVLGPRPQPAPRVAVQTSARPAPFERPLGVPALRPATGDPSARALLLAEIRDDLGECTRCRLSEQRSHIVFGEGSADAPVVFVGEGPGADEDRTGRPFVGRAGELLTKIIASVGWSREDVYICNIVKCRPPGNRDPELDEVATCRPFLERQLDAIRPRVIVSLGKPATSTLLGRPVAISKVRGIWQEWRGIPVMPTFHPAFLLRNYTREARQAVWDDLRAVRARVDADSADA